MSGEPPPVNPAFDLNKPPLEYLDLVLLQLPENYGGQFYDAKIRRRDNHSIPVMGQLIKVDIHEKEKYEFAMLNRSEYFLHAYGKSEQRGDHYILFTEPFQNIGAWLCSQHSNIAEVGSNRLTDRFRSVLRDFLFGFVFLCNNLKRRLVYIPESVFVVDSKDRGKLNWILTRSDGPNVACDFRKISASILNFLQSYKVNTTPELDALLNHLRYMDGGRIKRLQFFPTLLPPVERNCYRILMSRKDYTRSLEFYFKPNYVKWKLKILGEAWTQGQDVKNGIVAARDNFYGLLHFSRNFASHETALRRLGDDGCDRLLTSSFPSFLGDMHHKILLPIPEFEAFNIRS